MRVIPVAFLITVLLTACGESARDQSNRAVQNAIEAYLRQRQNLMLANMDLEVKEIKIDGDTAEAEVRFRSKQNAALAVTVRYKLKRAGQGWQVESSTSEGGPGASPHGTAPPAPAPAHGAPALESSH